MMCACCNNTIFMGIVNCGITCLEPWFVGVLDWHDLIGCNCHAERWSLSGVEVSDARPGFFNAWVFCTLGYIIELAIRSYFCGCNNASVLAIIFLNEPWPSNPFWRNTERSLFLSAIRATGLSVWCRRTLKRIRSMRINWSMCGCGMSLWDERIWAAAIRALIWWRSLTMVSIGRFSASALMLRRRLTRLRWIYYTLLLIWKLK